MAKKPTLRIASTPENVSLVIDRGQKIDEETKKLNAEAEPIKAQVAQTAKTLLQPGEISLKLAGNTALATVSLVTKYELNATHEKFSQVEPAIASGVLHNVVTSKKTLHIPPEQLEQAVEILKAGGVKCLVQAEYNVDAEGYRQLIGSPASTVELQQVVSVLKECVTEKTTTRVSYEAKS